MTLQLDPEENETRALFSLFDDFTGKSVLEIGCGDGRLTWRYARHAGRVTALDMNADKLARARAHRSDEFAHVHFVHLDLESFAAQNKDKFDIAILAWSL